MILAIDPGREKCGLAVLDTDAKEKKIIKTEEIEQAVTELFSKYKVDTIVIGSGTASKPVEKLVAGLDLRTDIVFFQEKYSTAEARKRYWKENPPKGLLKLIPTSLLFPPRPVDDYAAVILGERYLKG